ncbi:prenyltransferase [Enterococcus saccharolyticus]|uniref:prenyltransferase n=1 Tax=Enterococcus saccharolyticus TaxID=41997 RepID=UPI001E47A799|nr:prenyltransferase [Enterococcus saccharolyticus]MCD5001982.1 prenyltransferase [Enterococcus saccharolyticus]
MSVAVFLELVEIKAKTASVLPFLIGLCYSWYRYGSIHIGYVAIYFIAMFIFNMAVDILDNYNDYHHATEGHDYKEKTNIIGRENLSLRLVFWLMTSMIVISALLGIGLATVVGWPLLWMGLYCYLVGIFYSSGPRPLSSLPLGEFFSGSTMGVMISFICVYLNTFETFHWNFSEIFSIFIIALPNTMWIANLMLANNLCDKEEDEKNERYTLVHYLGRKNSIRLFVGMNVVAFLGIILSVIMGLAPMTVLLTFLAGPFILKQIRRFKQKQVKTETFICAVRILAVGSVMQVITYLIGILI